jgi:hypothetical protein
MVVPIGARARIQFNAHRIYEAGQLTAMFEGLELETFTLIPDDAADGDLVTDPSPALLARQRYGCGCFVLRRPAAPR